MPKPKSNSKSKLNSGSPKNYFKPNAGFGGPVEESKKYCRCVLHVAADQPDWCLEEGFPRTSRDGDKCYNPYAICTASLGRKGLVECFLNYNLENIPERELNALLFLKEKLLKKYKLPKSHEGLVLLQEALERDKYYDK